MADEPEQEEGAPKKPGMLMTLLLPSLIGFMAGGMGFATVAIVPKMMASSEEEEPELPPVFHEFGEVVSNLDEGELSRYLRVKLTLQIDGSKEEDLVKKLDEQKSVLKSWLNSYFSSKQLVDVRGAEGQNALRREIQNKFNSVVASEGFEDVQDVLFEEFQIQ